MARLYTLLLDAVFVIAWPGDVYTLLLDAGSFVVIAWPGDVYTLLLDAGCICSNSMAR